MAKVKNINDSGFTPVLSKSPDAPKSGISGIGLNKADLTRITEPLIHEKIPKPKLQVPKQKNKAYMKAARQVYEEEMQREVVTEELLAPKAAQAVEVDPTDKELMGKSSML